MSLVWIVLVSIFLIWLSILGRKLLVDRAKFPLPTEHRPIKGAQLGDCAGVWSIQGGRAHMEDTYQAVASVDGDPSRAFFAVYDGHGGHRASDYTAQHLHKIVLQSPMYKFEDDPVMALENGFKELDQNWLKLATPNNWDDGSTAVAALITGGTLFVANAGDSRAVLSHCGKAVEMSHDHKPAREDEKRRIEKLGGRIIHYGTWRVEGVLAVTRAIGDRRLKRFVSAVPEIKMRSLKEGDQWLILASDGVWDLLTPQMAVDIVCSVGHTKGGAQLAARRVVEAAYKRGSMDNITALVVDLRSYRSPHVNVPGSIPSSPAASSVASCSSSSSSSVHCSSPASSLAHG